MNTWLPESTLRLLAQALCCGWLVWKLLVLGRWWQRQLLGESLSKAFQRELRRRGMAQPLPAPKG